MVCCPNSENTTSVNSASPTAPLTPTDAKQPSLTGGKPSTVNVAPGVSFIVRPFPPPNLVGVPIEYVVTQLRKLAPHYWAKNETADCTLIVPMGLENRYKSKRTEPLVPSISGQSIPSLDPLLTGPFASSSDGRRSSAPIIGEGIKKRLIVKLHRDYLSSQSTFFRSMFSGTSPLDLANPINPKPTSKLSAGAFPVPFSAQPRLLPCAPNHPQLFLPLPDPTSFPHIVHYLYFGKVSYIEECLSRGTITWEGIVRNVEYLGLRDDIKIFLGRWWGNWLDPTRHRRGSIQYRHPVIEEESDGDEGGDEADNTRPRLGSQSPRSKARTKRRSQELQYPPSP